MPGCQTRYLKRTRPKIGLKLISQRASDGRVHLVLDSDVQAGTRLILRGQEPPESFSQFIPDGEQAVTPNVERHTPTKQPDAGYHGERRRSGAICLQAAAEFRQQ